jgi:hypothetical protein
MALSVKAAPEGMMKSAIAFALLVPAVILAQLTAPASGSIPAAGDEFVGPFPSWTNVRTAYGAVGNGSIDDTDALQRALNDLGKPGRSPVLFLPSGTYRITKTLVLAFNINLSVVGEDPATTIILWDGDRGGTMLAINGVAYSRFTRLTLDGRRTASIAIDQSWDNSRPHFDTGNEYSDSFFVDVAYGLHGGFKGHGFAETSIRRSHFVRNTKAGISLGNFNALDIWVWDSTFEDCAVGVTNTEGAGNFHVYNSIFRRSMVADLVVENTGGFSARGNYSAGSGAFFVSAGGTNNPATIHLQGNIIVDPLASTPIRFGNQGPGLITDNVIRSRPEAIGPVISWTSFFDADLASVGNTFTVTNPIRNNGRLIAIDDRVVARDTLRPVEPAMPATLPRLTRPIFEVPAGADAADIQSVLVSAARQKGGRPIVHIPYGIYSIDETLTVPAGDIQLVGDGYGTILRWTGAGAGPVVRLWGPSQATMREIQVDGATKASGIVVEDLDQVGSRVYMDQAQMRGGRQTDLFVNGLDNTSVQLEDIGSAYSPMAAAIKVVGGKRSAAGNVTTGKTNVFSGASSGHRTSYDISAGARVLVRDLWYESGAGPGFAKIHGRAVFTIDAARISSPTNQTPPALDIAGLDGRVTVLLVNIDDRIVVSGDGRSSNVLGIGIFAERKAGDYFVNAASPAARAVLLNSRNLSSLPMNRSTSTDDVGAIDATFIKSMLAHTRGEHPARLTALPNGISDVRLFRVWVTNGLNNIELTAASSSRH